MVGPIDNNAYLIRCKRTGMSVLVDAADDIDQLTQLVGDSTVKSIVTTHGHWDHHQAADDASQQFGAPTLLHPLDRDIAGKAFEALDPGPLSIGEVDATVVHTPGHTPGSVCVILDGVVLTGDTLFPGGPGATRFDHSSFPTIIESIRSHLFTLPDETVVLPGHGDSTTIGKERDQLDAWIARGW
ncbi:MAG: MBL fold metallo-hydrolase [Armatimonadetes bacterium]|nr:MAG: MBL fold metallo-hydrolase [Armatimonadota bacterium]